MMQSQSKFLNKTGVTDLESALVEAIEERGKLVTVDVSSELELGHLATELRESEP